jgi:flavin-dependent dehydrogenase
VTPAYEVAILGGGPAGCATAIALRRLGIEGVVVVEADGYERVRLGESIPPDSRVALERLGVWPGFVDGGHEPCLGSCSAWGDGALGYNDFLFNPHGHGWHLDRRRFDAFLAVEAVAAGAELATGCTFKGAERPAGGAFELRLARRGGGPTTVRARFVVDATGRRSSFARSMGARQVFHDRLTYVAAFMRRPSASVLTRLTMLEAVEYGWWYAARLPGERLAVAVASDPDLVKSARLHTSEGWLAGLGATRHLARELAGCRIAGNRVLARVAPSFVLDRSAGNGWLAVGDAASACDPISSQGIHNALNDGLRAAEAIAARLGGDARALRGYHASIAARFADYLNNRNYFYALERRWPAAPFWARRSERGAVG